MKNYLIIMVLLGLFVSCGPPEEQDEKLSNLVAEWKNISAKVVSLSEKIGDQMNLLEATKQKADSTNTVQIEVQSEQSNCDAEYTALSEKVNELTETLKVNSQKVDVLTNHKAIGKWTDEDEEILEALDLEIKEADASAEKWLLELEELKMKCGIISNDPNS